MIYKTKQLDELIAYMKLMKGRHVTVQEICDHFRKRGIQIGMTTIYRQLEKLVEDQTVVKYVIDQTSGACFEYVGDAETEYNSVHVHCKCKICGILLHIDCREATELTAHMRSEHGFEIDPFRTVFYGRCSRCAEGSR